MTVMFDSIFNTAYPAGAEACAAYIDGNRGDQPNYHAIAAVHPSAYLLSIALDAAHDADCLDIEFRAATAQQFPGWHARQVARGVARPVVYASAVTMAAFVLPVLDAAGIARPSVRLWSAHFGKGAHICGPGTCGLVPVDVDGTQWRATAQVDESLLLPTFFSPRPVPVPDWQVEMMRALPWVSDGNRGSDVKTVQALCNARLRADELTIDGIFGPATLEAVKRVQAIGQVVQDGTVGPKTWPVLLGIA